MASVRCEQIRVYRTNLPGASPWTALPYEPHLGVNLAAMASATLNSLSRTPRANAQRG